MNRPIKFRAWDAHNKVMINPYCELRENRFWGEDLTNTGYSDPVSVMQFTGLRHEKTGVEIFEGDIFREEIEEDEGDRRNYKVVMWIPQRAAFYLVDVSHISVIEDNSDNPKFQEDKFFAWLYEEAALYDFSIDVGLPLVGNIYQNPELLK